MSKDALHKTLQQRVYGSINADLLFKRARSSKYLIQCLQRNGTLTGHEGCVNTIVWSESGDLLLSGSDDCMLNIYRPHQKKLLQSIRTGHRANIFSAKFLPCTADKWIVSCAGDGMIQFTDLETPESHGKRSYNCHSGTAYEVITTPGDPNTFISCGEDGTVRMFDTRTKSHCAARDCKEDVLIDCGKAVTSVGLNPLTPYELGIGCEDSTVALFDRRSLSTANSNHGMQGMLCKFKPDALKDRTCRVTSLQYSSDGCELLVSYCADYIYLFNTRGEKEVRIPCEAGGQENGAFSNHNRKESLPLKRLRLRGDWSDTGPNSRPESEAASTESTLMQRMSDLFVRWIEESFRGNQRSRLRSASQMRSDSSSASNPPSLLSRTSNESSFGSSGATIPFDAGTTNPEATDMTIDESPVEIFDSAESGPSKREGENQRKNCTSDGESNSEKMEVSSNIDLNVAGTSGLQIEITNTEKSIAKSDNSGSDTKLSGSDEEYMEIQTVVESNVDVFPLERTPKYRRQDVIETRNEISQGTVETGDEVLHGVAETRGEIPQGLSETRDELQQGVAETRGELPQVASETSDELQQSVTEARGGVPRDGVETRGEVSPSAVTQEPIQESFEHNVAATRIQRVFRNYRLIKNFEKSFGVKSIEEKEVWIPKMNRVFRGHRNARTMIKEARFWGDHFIVSGSDCGRIFIWDKDTTEIVMVLHGDRHVVNCVQPHPFDPTLASSGIDYDIKLWAPTAETPLHIDGLDEIIQRNEQMLEESRDTITVPASFMLRMLASLNHARFAQNQDDSDSDSTDEA